ncbi:MAG: ribosomal protein S18-alanine N-acetyltransferase [Gammaproteobacteria bacterium]|nr:ribosomal protein S18-alanine N-acetyltransferase [Gammaproteobacteria bacterium]
MNNTYEPEFYVMTLENLSDVLKIENEVALAPWSIGIFKDCLKSGYAGFILKINHQSIGFAIMSMAVGECHLLNIAIAKAYQKQGYGKVFLDFLIDEAQENKMQQVFLEVRISNTVAQKLYLSKGFNEIDRRKNYYPNGRNGGTGKEDALIFALQLFNF